MLFAKVSHRGRVGLGRLNVFFGLGPLALARRDAGLGVMPAIPPQGLSVGRNVGLLHAEIMAGPIPLQGVVHVA